MPKKQSKRASSKKQRNVSINKRKVSSVNKPTQYLPELNKKNKKNMQMCFDKMYVWMYKI